MAASLRLLLVTLVLACCAVFASGASLEADAGTAGKNRIVILKNHGLSTMEGRIHGLQAEGARSNFRKNARQHHNRLLSKVKGTKGIPRKVHDYTQLMSGFSAVLTDAQAQFLQADPDVFSVTDDKLVKMLTTRSYTFMGLDNSKTGAWRKTKGSNTIVGVIDTGVWPEDASFRDTGYDPVPSTWKGYCEVGEGFDDFKCNRKLIGAKTFGDGYAAYKQDYLSNLVESCGDYLSPRDIEGHGSHCAGIATGTSTTVTVNGQSYGTARDVAFDARLAVYKIFWCGDSSVTSDIVAAMDAAVQDGVDVMSLSLGSGPASRDSITGDPISFAAYQANVAGVAVVFAAGNDGPDAFTADNTAPWIMTVAAGTIDRVFASTAVLGNKATYQGLATGSPGTPSASSKKLFPLVSADRAAKSGANKTAAELCGVGTLDATKVKGKIVVCLRGDFYLGDKATAVLTAGGVGMIIRNQQSKGSSIVSSQYPLPALLVTYKDGLAITAYITRTKNPVGYLQPSRFAFGPSVVEAPHVSEFSSAGPNAASLNFLKPDITGPGEDILSAWTQEKGSSQWNIISGTSMATPHVAGAIALLSALHPTWTPSMYYSALATTAKTKTNRNNMIKTSSGAVATPFEVGAGYLNPNAATDPGLVYAITDYKSFLCSPDAGLTSRGAVFNRRVYCPSYPSTRAVDLNLPSVTIYKLSLSSVQQTIRTLTNVGSAGTYVVSVIQPPGTTVSVSPTKITFKKNQSISYNITATPLQKAVDAKGSFATTSTSTDTIQASLSWTFGSITWADNKGHVVRIPVAVNAV